MNQVAREQKVDIKQRFFRFNTLLAFLAAAVVIYIFITRFDIARAFSIITNVNIWLTIVAFLVFYGLIPLRGYRWRALLVESNINLPTFELTRAYFLAFFVNAILPAKIGDIYRAYLLKKNRDISFPLSLGVLFSERIFDLASTAMLVMLGGIFYLGEIASPELRNKIIYSLLIIGVIILAFIIFSWRSNWLIRFLPRSFQKHYQSFTDGLFRSPSKIPLILLLSLIVWASEAARLYFVCWAIGARIDFMLAIFISQAALILMSLPLTPAGLGLVELLMLALLVPAGFSRETAAAIIIADRLISYWSLIILGGLHYIISPRYR